MYTSFGEALGALSGAGGYEPNMDAALQHVAIGVGISFDTTITAIFMSLIAFVIQSFVRRKESTVMSDVEDYLTYRLLNRV